LTFCRKLDSSLPAEIRPPPQDWNHVPFGRSSVALTGKSAFSRFPNSSTLFFLPVPAPIRSRKTVGGGLLSPAEWPSSPNNNHFSEPIGALCRGIFPSHPMKFVKFVSFLLGLFLRTPCCSFEARRRRGAPMSPYIDERGLLPADRDPSVLVATRAPSFFVPLSRTLQVFHAKTPFPRGRPAAKPRFLFPFALNSMARNFLGILPPAYPPAASLSRIVTRVFLGT